MIVLLRRHSHSRLAGCGVLPSMVHRVNLNLADINSTSLYLCIVVSSRKDRAPIYGLICIECITYSPAIMYFLHSICREEGNYVGVPLSQQFN